MACAATAGRWGQPELEPAECRQPGGGRSRVAGRSLGEMRLALASATFLLTWSWQVAAAPNDPLFAGSGEDPGQWNLMGTADPAHPEAGVRGIDAEGAWELTAGRPDVVVAVLDSGVLLTHEDLIDNIDINAAEAVAGGIPDPDGDGLITLAEAAIVVDDLDEDGVVTPKDVLLFVSDGIDDDGNGYVDDLVGWDFDEDDNDPTDTYGHGTGRAGIVAASYQNGVGMAGVCPRCRVLPVRFGRTFVAQPDKLAEAIAYAADRGATSTVMATGGLGNSQALRAAVAYADARGVTQCSAIGNERARHPHYPQAYEDIIAVTGITPTDRSDPDDWSATWSGSNFGAHAAVAAPTYVYATGLNGGYSVEGGTSSSVPHCAGVAALVQSRARDLGITLSPRQVRAILTMTADDWPEVSARRGAGRLNARAAVEAVQAGPPPEARLVAPHWFTTGPDETLDVDVVAPPDATVVLEIGDGVEPTEWQTIEPGPIPVSPPGLDPSTDVLGAAYAVTLRLTVTDAAGRASADRRTVYAHRDPSEQPGFPVDVGESTEGAPVLADLDGDGADEIVFATSGGVIHVLSGAGEPAPGWPQRVGSPSTMHADAAAHASGAVPTCCATIFATVSVGDIDGDARPELVVSALDGKLYAFRTDGAPVGGFPFDLGAASWAGQALADLDGDGALEIIAAGFDRNVHVVDGRGSELPGFPVLLHDDTAQDVVPGLVATPSVGDIDGDGDLELVVATTESQKIAEFLARGRVYAFEGNGSPIAGFPVQPFGAIAETFPVVGSGVPGAPLLADLDGDGASEIVSGHAAGQLVAFRGDGTVFSAFDHGAYLDLLSPFGPPVSLADPRYDMNALLLGQPIAADLDLDGAPEIMAPTMGIATLDIAAAQENPGELLTMLETVFSVWTADGALLEPWPIPMEGWALFGGATVIDVSGDGLPEVVYGSDAGWLHARDVSGQEAPGFPKFYGGWMGPVASAGDIDGDGLIDLVASTRQGQVFAWSTGVEGCSAEAPWPLHHHDAQSTSALSTPIEGACVGEEVLDYKAAGGCTCAAGSRRSGAGTWLAGLGLLLLVARRARKVDSVS